MEIWSRRKRVNFNLFEREVSGGGRRREGLSIPWILGGPIFSIRHIQKVKVSRVGSLFGSVHHVLVAVGEPKEIRRGVISLKPHLTDLAAPATHMYLSLSPSLSPPSLVLSLFYLFKSIYPHAPTSWGARVQTFERLGEGNHNENNGFLG